MATSVDDGVAEEVSKFTAQIHAQRLDAAVAGSFSARGAARPVAPAYPASNSNGAYTARHTNYARDRDGGRQARLAASAALTAQSHGIPVEPASAYSSQAGSSSARSRGASNRIGRGAGSESAADQDYLFSSSYGGAGPSGSYGGLASASALMAAPVSLHAPRTWEHVPLRPLEEVRPPRRYFSSRLRKLVYSGEYWSAPLARRSSRRSQAGTTGSFVGSSGAGSDNLFVPGGPGGSGEGVLLRPLDRKLLPVPELLRRIEEAQRAQEAREAEAARAPIRARQRALRLARGLPLHSDDEGEDESIDPVEPNFTDLLSAMDPRTLQRLKGAFHAHRSRSLGLEEFVGVMRRFLPAPSSGGGDDEAREINLVASLCAFFQNVDVNGDQTMEWSEFTSFITDTGLATHAATSSSSSGGYPTGGGMASARGAASSGAGGPTPGSHPDAHGHDAPHEYRKAPASATEDPRCRFAQPLSRLFYFDQPLDHLLALQETGGKFDVFKTSSPRLAHYATVEGHTGPVLAAEYVDVEVDGGGASGAGGGSGVVSAAANSSASRHRFVVTAGNDRTLRFWDPLEHYRPLRSLCGGCLPSDQATVVLRWAQGHATTGQRGMLFGAGDQRAIKAYRIERAATGAGANTGAMAGSLSSARNSSFITSQSKLPHAQYLLECTASFMQPSISLDLLVLDNLSSLACASLDGSIALFDIQTQARSSVLKGGHARGVFQLAYNPALHILVSAGFDHSATVWNPYVAAKICRLQGHYAPLIGVACPPDSRQIVTADSAGGVKVWDMRNFSCVQSFFIEESGGGDGVRGGSSSHPSGGTSSDGRVTDLRSFVALAPHKKLVSASKHQLFVHESMTSSAFQSPDLADAAPTLLARFNTSTGSFVSAAGSTIKIWSGSTGCLERSYTNVLAATPASAGGSSTGGGVSGLSATPAAHAGSEADLGEITALVLDDAQRKIITGDSMGNVCVFNSLTGALLKRCRAAAKEVTGLAYVPGLKNILVTAWDGSVSLWDENAPEGIPLLKRLRTPTDGSERRGKVNGSGLGLSARSRRRSGSAARRHRSHVSATDGSSSTSSSSGCEIITTAYSAGLSLFASGSSSGLVSLWDYRSHTLVTELAGHASEITALAFLDPYPLLASADQEGNVCVWAVRPLVLNVGKCVLRLVNTVKAKGGAAAATGTAASAASAVCPVTALAFWPSIEARSYLASLHGDPGSEPLYGTPGCPPSVGPPSALLYAGDVRGVIRCWDLWGAIQRWGLRPFWTFDRLLPTGAGRDYPSMPTDVTSRSVGSSSLGSTGGPMQLSVDDDDDPHHLTDAEKRRMVAQIQSQGLAAGGTAGATDKSAHQSRRGSVGAGMSNLAALAALHEGDAAEAATEAASQNPTGAPSLARPNLPSLVQSLVSANLSPFTARAPLVRSVAEAGAAYGEGSVEYEAALAALPGATAAQWSLRQQAARRARAQAARAEELAAEAAKAKAARAMAFFNPSGAGVGAAAGSSDAQKRTLARVSSLARTLADSEEKEESGTGSGAASAGKRHANSSAPTATTLDSSLSMPPSAQLSTLASAKGPVVTYTFARTGPARLLPPEPKAPQQRTDLGLLAGGGAGLDDMVAGLGMGGTGTGTGEPRASAEDDAPSSGGLLHFPAIPLLPLSSLLSGSGDGANGGPASSAAPLLSPAAAAAAAALTLLPKSALRHSRSNDYVEYRRVHRALMNSLERHARERTHSLRPGDITLRHWWQAHEDSVRDITLVKEEAFAHMQRAPTAGELSSATVSDSDSSRMSQSSFGASQLASARAPRLHPLSSALLSCSFDRRVCLWDRSGNSLGHLQQGRTEEHTQLDAAGSTTVRGAVGSDGSATAVAATSASVSTSKQPDWLVPWRFHADVRGRYERAQGTARRVLYRLAVESAREDGGSLGYGAAHSHADASGVSSLPAPFDLSGSSDEDEADADIDRPERNSAGHTFLTQLEGLAPPAVPATTRDLTRGQNQSGASTSRSFTSVSAGGSVPLPLSARSNAPTPRVTSLGKDAPPLRQSTRDLLPPRIREVARTGGFSARGTH